MLNSNLMVLLLTSSAKLLADDVEYSVVQTLRVVAAIVSPLPQLRWHSSLSAKVIKNANLGYSHDRGLS